VDGVHRFLEWARARSEAESAATEEAPEQTPANSAVQVEDSEELEAQRAPAEAS
jgi:hypothetical protein